MGVQPEETPEETPAGGNVQAPPPAVTPAPSTTPKKKRVTSAKAANISTATRNAVHGTKTFVSGMLADSPC